MINYHDDVVTYADRDAFVQFEALRVAREASDFDWGDVFR